MTEQSIGELATKIVDPWHFWREALEDPSRIGKTIFASPGEPANGYYRCRRGKNGPFEPVAIWQDESGEWQALRAGNPVIAVDVWSWCLNKPISYESYLKAVETGSWDDDDASVAEQIATIGDNSGHVDEAETLKDQIEAALKGLSAYENITDDATAGKALSLRNRLNELSKQADNIRVKEKAPHLEAGKAVDDKYHPLVKKAKAGADTARDAIGKWETAKLIAERKRQQEALAAEQARIASQEERGAQNDVAGSAMPETTVAPVVAAPTSVVASYGRAASVQVKTVVTGVTDWPALAVYLSAHKELQELMLKLAQRGIDAGRTDIPGLTTEAQAKVR